MTDKEWQKLLRKVAEDIYEGKRKGTIDDKMVRETARKLMQGVEEGYGASLNDEDVADKKYDTLRKMQKDVYHFSGAKNWNQLREMSLLLNNAKGGIKTFEEYYRAVQQIDETYNKIYLRSEYENAVASAQMASKWDEIVADADTLPYLQYDAVMDERTRLTHREMHGIVLRWDDDFWKTYYPPNDWGCRCDVRQLDDAEVTDITKLKLKPNPPMFRNNVGIGGQVFSDKHPYYKSIPEDVRKDILIATEKLQPISTKDKRAVYEKPFDEQFTVLKSYKNGKLQMHELYKETDDHSDLLKYGTYKAKQGTDVRLLPEVHESETKARSILQAGAKGKSNVDFWINGDWWELESPQKTENLGARINSGYKQCDNVIIMLPEKITKQKLWGIALKKFKIWQNLKHISFYYENQEHVFNRDILLLE